MATMELIIKSAPLVLLVVYIIGFVYLHLSKRFADHMKTRVPQLEALPEWSTIEGTEGRQFERAMNVMPYLCVASWLLSIMLYGI